MQLSNLLQKSEGNYGYDTAQANDIRYRRWQRTRSIATGRPQAERRQPAIKRQHIGARVPQDKYRQLKAHAVLTGIPVQALVEKIIDQYLASLPKQDRA